MAPPPENPDLNMSLLQQATQQTPTSSAPADSSSSFSSPLKSLPSQSSLSSSSWQKDQQHLTGIAALASANIPPNPSSPRAGEEQRQQSGQQEGSGNANTGVTPNPADEVFKFPTSKPSDAPRHGGERDKDGPQAQLPSISTALDQHGKPTSSMFGTAGSPQSANSLAPGAFTPTPVSATRPDSAFPLSATSPLNPSNFPLSATTPTSPFSTLPTPTSANPNTPTTPSSARNRHICQHCNQGFTRVHNLKSHLLTHSKTKPYDCTACPAKFRRLHDLKRHSRLHTGERPHECPKCGRRFARGDALARHARGEAGCAGRRSSVSAGGPGGESGSYDDEEGYDDFGDGEDTLMVDAGGSQSGGGPSGNPPMSATSTGSDSERRRASLPSIRTTDLSRTPNPPTPGFLQHHPTYPPANSSSAQTPVSGRGKTPLQGRSPGKAGGGGGSSGMHGLQQPTPSSATPGGMGSLQHLHSASLLTPTLTQSPRALSPGGAAAPSGLSTSTSSNAQQSQSQQQQQAPHPPSLLPPSTPSSSTAAVGQQQQNQNSQNLHGQPTPVSAQPGSAGSILGGFGGMLAGSVGGGNEKFWGEVYVRALEERVKNLEERVRELEGRVGGG